MLKFKKPQNISDETLMMADIAAKARMQVASFVADVLTKRLPRKKAEGLAVILSEGRWKHDFPVTVQFAQQLGLPVTTQIPRIVYELMDLYPQLRPYATRKTRTCVSLEEGMGWLMGLEPTTTGITIRDSTN